MDIYSVNAAVQKLVDGTGGYNTESALSMMAEVPPRCRAFQYDRDTDGPGGFAPGNA